jgi:hypothetical protein
MMNPSVLTTCRVPEPSGEGVWWLGPWGVVVKRWGDAGR